MAGRTSQATARHVRMVGWPLPERMRISSPVTWHGGKSKLSAKIIRYFPPHQTYVEPFGGSAAVLSGEGAVEGRGVQRPQWRTGQAVPRPAGCQAVQEAATSPRKYTVRTSRVPHCQRTQ